MRKPGFKKKKKKTIYMKKILSLSLLLPQGEIKLKVIIFLKEGGKDFSPENF